MVKAYLIIKDYNLLTKLLKRQKTISVNWVYKTNLKKNGVIDKHKACLVGC